MRSILPDMVALVVMAAGLGSRFGGTKQIASVGANGEAFLDFAIQDALEAGVDDVVLVVRSEIEQTVRAHLRKHHGELEASFVCQDKHGPIRAKPWGTAHAVLVARELVNGPFLVCNADDYYSKSSFQSLAKEARNLIGNRALLAGFRLGSTLPAVGQVSRGVCQLDQRYVVSIVETHNIGKLTDGRITATESKVALANESIVSMNFWAFSEKIFGLLDAAFEKFIAVNQHDLNAEFMLPNVVNEFIDDKELTVEVIPVSESWIGVTHPEDLRHARQLIPALRAATR